MLTIARRLHTTKRKVHQSPPRLRITPRSIHVPAPAALRRPSIRWRIQRSPTSLVRWLPTDLASTTALRRRSSPLPSASLTIPPRSLQSSLLHGAPHAAASPASNPQARRPRRTLPSSARAPPLGRPSPKLRSPGARHRLLRLPHRSSPLLRRPVRPVRPVGSPRLPSHRRAVRTGTAEPLRAGRIAVPACPSAAPADTVAVGPVCAASSTATAGLWVSASTESCAAGAAGDGDGESATAAAATAELSAV